MAKTFVVTFINVLIFSLGLQLHSELRRSAEKLDVVANKSQIRKARGPPCTEEEYQRVAALKSDSKMKDFIRHVIELEGRHAGAAAEADLNGLVPYYSGTVSVQSLRALKQEINEAIWLADDLSRYAALNEEGYHDVAELRSRPSMVLYMERILDAEGRVANATIAKSNLFGMSRYFDGEVSIQSFNQLRKELLSASWTVEIPGWNKSHNVTVAKVGDTILSHNQIASPMWREGANGQSPKTSGNLIHMDPELDRRQAMHTDPENANWEPGGDAALV